MGLARGVQGTENAVSCARPQLVGLAASGRPSGAELRRGDGEPQPPGRPHPERSGRRRAGAPSRAPRGGVSASTGVRGLELGIYSFVLPRFVRL